MRRKSFDALVSVGGLLLTVVLVAAGALLLWAYSFSNNTVTNQLSAQKITFPTATELAHPNGGEITPSMEQYLGRYAGQPLTTGPEAKAYAEHFIAVHLSEMPYHGVYSQVSAASLAQPSNTALAAEVQTVFRGTTLQGLLLEAYAFSEFGEIAMIASILSFGLAGVMLLLSGFGIWHLRRTDPATEVLEGHLGIGQRKTDSTPSFA